MLLYAKTYLRLLPSLKRFGLSLFKKAMERNGHGAKGPRSESSRERIGQGLIGRFAPRTSTGTSLVYI